MDKKYEPHKIEQKWQKIWQEKKLFETKPKGENYYILDMFPYPSGAGLHVGHPRGYTATDVFARYQRLKGKNVLHPMGWDAFGLPAENYAIKNKIHPRIAVEENITKFKQQISSFGFSYDWSREINTTDPSYYKWTQWIFLKFFKRGLAYEADAPINWCPSCKTGLANEEVLNGKCERCHSKVETKKIRQWMLKITKYADRLLEDLKDLDWPEPIKLMQKNWIGKSQGALLKFKIANSDYFIDVFTTRPDTLFGCSYIVLSPEHNLIEKIKNKKGTENFKVKNLTKLLTYCKHTAQKKANNDKTGIKLEGMEAINPVNNQSVPIFVADYVLAEYGTGAIMAVPAHDIRDFEFAKKFNLPIRFVVSGSSGDGKAYTGPGKMINSGIYNGLTSIVGGKRIMQDLIKKGMAKKTTNYKLRDWVFSRQRYWGEPIPLIHCLKCGIVPVPEKDLPVVLPEIENYKPTGTGESPLAKIKDWVNTKCPKCNGVAKRETNTMPQWAGSCWYYIAYLAKKPNSIPAMYELNQSIIDKWLPVNLYVGGAEHAVLHLLYARFWHKVLYDEGIVKAKEPFKKLINVGIILAPDGQKMSKSRGNVINPDDIIKKYGADSLRLYELFIGPFNQKVVWDSRGIIGMKRFLDKIFLLDKFITKDKNSIIDDSLHETIKKVGKDIGKFAFNTAIAKIMELVNLVNREKKISLEQYKILLIILSPFTPHLCDELWQNKGFSGYASMQKIPQAKVIKQQFTNIPVQINGKVRAQITISNSSSKDEVIEKAKKSHAGRFLDNQQITKIIYIPLKIINFVLK